MRASNLLGDWQFLVSDSLVVDTPAPSQVSIVAIDERSLEYVGAWPWHREVFASVIDKLTQLGVRTVAFDVTFLESRAGDIEFAAALERSQLPVVLAGKLLEGEYFEPVSAYTGLPNVTTGFATLSEESDAKVRVATLYSPDRGGLMHPSLGYAALLNYFEEQSTDYANISKLGFTNIPGRRTEINYFGSAGTFNTISLVDLLTDTGDLGSLQNDLVFVGVTVQDLKQGLDDNFVTPAGSMPGVEIHANLAGTIIADKLINQPEPYIWMLVWLGLVVVAYTLLRWQKNVGSYNAALLGLFVAYSVLAIALFNFHIKLDLFYVPLGLVLLMLGGDLWHYMRKYGENKELRKAFTQYVNERLLDKILADPSQLRLGGQRKEMTVLFSDIRGFTGISERMSAEELVHFLNEYLSTATDVILENDGIVDKYLGDAIMAIWNAPLDDPDHALHACITALRIKRVLAEFNQKIDASLPELKIGIGINTGEMVVGNMGSQRRFDYTVMGDNVNLSSRLEGLTKKYGVEVLVGEGVVQELVKLHEGELIHNLEFRSENLEGYGIWKLETDGESLLLAVRRVDLATVKGKQTPINIYEVTEVNEEELKEKQQLFTKFSSALQLYIDGNFLKAAEEFGRLVDAYQDLPSEMLYTRCKQLMDTDLKWPGYWKWDEK